MSIANALMINDLQYLPPQPLEGRPNLDPDVISEASFRDSHRGMSRAEWKAMQAAHARADADARAVADLEGDMPGSTTRDRWSAYLGTLADERRKLDSAVAKRGELSDIIAAPGARESKIQAAVRRTADFLLGKASAESDADQRDVLDIKWAAEKHGAEAAQLAMVEVERDIEKAQVRVRHLVDREKEFLAPVMWDLGEPLRQEIGQRRADLAAIEKIAEPLNEYQEVTFGRLEKKTESNIKWRHSWLEIVDTLRANPRADVTKLLPNI